MTHAPVEALLIAGGDQDPNVRHLLARIEARAIAHRSLLIGSARAPTLTWELEQDRLWLDGVLVEPRAVFVRHDVFTSLADGRSESAGRALAWYVALSGWLERHTEVRTLNRGYLGQTTNKLAVLQLARECGLAIPRTCVSNDLTALDRFCVGAAKIAKPVAGGSLTRDYAELREQIPRRGEIAAAPAIVQHRMVAPEVRIYRVGARLFAFTVDSPSLDYREQQDARLAELELARLPADLQARLLELCERLGLDYAAADFKTDPDSGELAFLEINSAAMFVAFDRIVEGRLCDAIIDRLISAA